MLDHSFDMYNLAVSSKGQLRKRAMINSLMAAEGAIIAAYVTVELRNMEEKASNKQ